MKNINNILVYFLLILAYTSISLATDVTIYTPEGKSLIANVSGEMSASMIAFYNQETDDDIVYYGLNAVRIGDASWIYNCHGYAWMKSEDRTSCWFNLFPTYDFFSEDGSYSNDNLASYLLSAESSATHSFYTDVAGGHSTRKIQNSYPVAIDNTSIPGATLDHISKWGDHALVQHAKNHDVYHLGNSGSENYRILKNAHYGTLSSYPKTWVGAGGKTHTITNNLTVPSTVTLTVKQGTTVQFTYGKNMTISGTLISEEDITIPTGSTLTVNSGAQIKFAAGKKLIVNGTLNATSATFTDITTGTTWGGIVFQSGSNGNLNGCNINHVLAYGAGAIAMNNASPQIQYCTIENNTSGSTSGISLVSGANPYVHHNTIRNNSSHAVSINNAYGKFQYNNIYGTANKYCLYAYDAAPIFSYSSPTPYYEGKNLLRDGLYGIYATAGSNVAAGYTAWAYNNSIHNNSSYNVIALSSSVVSAVNNWWNTINPDVIEYKLSTDGTSTIYYYPFLDEAPSTSLMKLSDDIQNLDSDFSNKLYQAIELRLSGKEEEALLIIKEILKNAPDSKEAVLALNEIGRFTNLNLQASVKDYIDVISKSEKYDNKLKAYSELLLGKIIAKQGDIYSAIEVNNGVKTKHKGTEYELLAGIRNFFLYYNNGEIKNAEMETEKLKSVFGNDENIIAVEWLLGIENDSYVSEGNEYQEDTEENEENIPAEITLVGNYPNPFNPNTVIKYTLPVMSNVKLAIYNMLGQEIKTFESSSVSEGVHQFTWDGTNKNNEQVSSGIYIYRLKAVGNDGRIFEKSSKMLLLK